ncbi:11452_t:CDS:2 [Entrophospora sp. SA101]|nr:11452_t:CDS:2 [Entrophospora sp. SA101]
MDRQGGNMYLHVEAKLKLEATFGVFEFAYLGLDSINDELIFKEKEEIFDMFFNSYYLALTFIQQAGPLLIL